jgi:outer membrane protein assembly factor BamB
MEWRVKTGARGWTTPAVSDDAFFVGGSAIQALDPESGEELWRAAGEGTPAVRDGSVYVTGQGRVIALDAQSGDEQWTYTLGDPSRVPNSPVAVTEDAVYATGTALHAIDRATGEELWTFEPAGMTQDMHDPAASGEVVCVADSNGFTYGFDPVSGEELWNRVLSLRRPVASGPAVYGAGGRAVHKLAGRTGDTEWTYETNSHPQLADTISTQQADTVSEQQLYVSTPDATVFGLSTEGGRARELTYIGSWPTSPTIYEEGVLVGSDSRLYGLPRYSDNWDVEFEPRGDTQYGPVSAGRVTRGIVCVNFNNWTYGLDLSSY